ncbi:MAG: hypothetical protein LBM93_11685, partial [Oscillospiraceae bacterium]|nr:hypothetical protein [Oscillospiraceae bacterium]
MKDIFKDPSIYYLIVIAIVSCITGVIAYNIAIRNRGSFVDTPDWTKVARRIIELIIVFVVLLFLCYMFFREWGLYFLLFSGIPIICCFITVGIVMKIIGWQNSNLIYK